MREATELGADPLTRVRGRIDHLGTARGRPMESGRILCRYEEQTVDLPRYRYMLVTLRRAARRAVSSDVRRRCLATAQMLERSGVLPMDPTAAQMSTEQYGHFDATDKKLVLMSKLVRDMCAPEHSPGMSELPAILRNEHALRRLFEEAVRGFYRHHLGSEGYSVKGERREWPTEGDADARALVPRLNSDVLVRGHGQQTVIECKFGPIFDWYHGKAMLKPGYVRQLFSYATVFSREFEGQTRAVLRVPLSKGLRGAIWIWFWMASRSPSVRSTYRRGPPRSVQRCSAYSPAGGQLAIRRRPSALLREGDRRSHRAGSRTPPGTVARHWRCDPQYGATQTEVVGV